MDINLEDSHYMDPICISEESKRKGIQHERFCNSKESPFWRSAIDSLQRQFDVGDIKVLSLRNTVITDCLDGLPVWYRTESAWRKSSQTSEEIIKFYTSHYIGNCILNGVSIKINPRFGGALFNHILQYACNIYLPKGCTFYAEGNAENAYWLIGLLWKAILERALNFGQIPKEYKSETKNIKTFKGRLNIQKHIKANIVDQSRFYCKYRKLTMDNVINQTIRYTHSILKKKGIGKGLNNIASYDEKLESFGVSCFEINPSDIDKVKYTKMNIVYKPVLEFSKAIILHHFAETKSDVSKQAEAAFFIDMAELWEMYLLRILQNNLSDDYSVYSPNLSTGSFLLEDNFRSIRPDIIIEKNHRVVMIIDAKYKRYETLGKSAQDRFAVSREDLYQMTTYLYHYGKADESIYGIFASPANYKYEDPKNLEHNPLHKIGLINMEIDRAEDNLEALQQNERLFVERITKILEKEESARNV